MFYAMTVKSLACESSVHGAESQLRAFLLKYSKEYYTGKKKTFCTSLPLYRVHLHQLEIRHDIMNYNGLLFFKGGVREAKSELFISLQAGGIGGLGDTREQGLQSFQPRPYAERCFTSLQYTLVKPEL